MNRASRGEPAMGLIDIDAAAERLGVTPRFIRRMVAQRRIPYLKVGKFVRFDPTELDERRISQVHYE